MKVISLLSALSLAFSDQVVQDEAGVSLLQHSVRTIRKVEDPPGVPPPGVAERQAARREARKAARVAGRSPSDLPADKLERRQNRRLARRVAKREAHAAGAAHFNDGGSCDTCAAHCTGLFEEVFQSCMISENCQPWQKEDGPTADKCKKRCDRTANWRREPCIRGCQCDVDLLATKESHTWASGLHRCQEVPLGQTSECDEVASGDTAQYDSIKKCAKQAVDAGADTFNFYRTSKEFGKCSVRHCGSADLKIGVGPRVAEAPAGRGTWKTFSTYCRAPAQVEQSGTGPDQSSR